MLPGLHEHTGDDCVDCGNGLNFSKVGEFLGGGVRIGQMSSASVETWLFGTNSLQSQGHLKLHGGLHG